MYSKYTTLLESIFHLTSDGIVVVDLEGRVLEINKKFEELHGWTREEIIGKVLPMTPVRDRAGAYQLYKRILNGEQFSGLEAMKLRKDGSTFYAAVTISPVKDESGNIIAFVGVERDITEKKRAEQALKESEERYRILVESSPEPIVVFTDSRISFANSAAAKLVGAETADSLIGGRIYDFIHPEYVTDLTRRVGQLLQDGAASEMMEKKLIRLDGQVLDVEVRAVAVNFGEAFSVLLLFRDVTERKQVEMELLERERQYRRVLKLSPEPIVLHREGIVQFVNDMGVKLFAGKSLDDFVGRSIYDFICPSYHSMISERMNQLLQTNDYLDFIEMKVIRLDGTALDVEVASIYIYKHVGYPVIQIVIRDMTERKKAEEMMRRSEKLSAIGQLAAGIAHEIRNPLTSLKGFTQLLKARNTQYVDVMMGELERIEYIVNEFMTLAKPHIAAHTITRIQSLVENVVLFMQPQALLCSVQINLTLEDDLKPISCDSNQIKQVVMNLLKNAMESMPEGGTIEVEVKCTPTQGILIHIVDHGIGIPEDKLSRLGEPFFSMKENGTGLGLMICQRIIEAHRGKMSIQSKIGQGTAVRIELPISI
ncbi:PAS domain S-box protein [Paenibacillus sp. HJGM_3]|uniref:PAS domain S-box protein n=1 Tax=Paenibacillus sp. HJGM_3 TaxID=3379816 RepID=UPI00385F67EB